MKRSEGFFKSFDDTQLYYQSWEVNQPQGTILITHGQGEHSDSYQHFVDHFKKDHWNFLSWDLRGHGRSEGKRGYVMYFDDYCKDYEIFLESFFKNKQTPSVISFSHSMGALIHLKTILNNSTFREKLTAQCLSSPFLGLSLPVPTWKIKGSRFIYAIKPDITLDNEIKDADLSRDPHMLKEFKMDSLRHHRISAGAFLGCVSSWDFVISKAQQIILPTILQMSDKDPIANTADARRFFEKISSTKKEIYLYPDAKHEIFNDIIRENAFRDLKKFLNSFLE